MGYFAIAVMGQLVEKKLFGGLVIRLSNFLQLSYYLYECGAILGRARRDDPANLARLLPVMPRKEDELMQFLQESAHKRLDKFRQLRSGNEPSSFFDLFYTTELEKIGIRLWEQSDMKRMNKALDEKMPLDKAEPLMKAFGQESVGFGIAFPQMTETLYRNSRENIDPNDWAEMRQQGIAISENPAIISFEE